MKNRIKRTYLIADSDFLQCKKFDTISFLKYDNKGSVLEESAKGVLYGTRITYKYDSLSLQVSKKYSTDFSNKFNFIYEFNLESLVLYKRYKSPIHKNINGEKLKVSGKFKFNKLGFLIKSSDYQNNDYGAGGRLVTEYEYDSLNLLKYKKTHIDLSKIADTIANWHTSFKRSTKFYYTNKKIDFSETTYFYLDTLKN